MFLSYAFIHCNAFFYVLFFLKTDWVGVCAGPHLKYNAEEASPTDENVSPPKVEEGIGGAIPDALSTDANVAQRFDL